MKLPETYSRQRSVSGFTLFELMLVMAMVIIIGVFTSSIGIAYYQSQILNETTDNLVSTLRQAQGSAQSGKNNHAFGVFIDEDSYVLFEGQDYLSRIIDQDVVFPINSNVTISGPSEIIFTELTGNANVSDTLYISLGTKEKQISILDTGYIDK